MSIEHEWLFIASHGQDAPGQSLDTYEQCARCGAVKHDYRHGGGLTSPNYPDLFKYGVRVDRAHPCLAIALKPATLLPSPERGPK